MRPRFRISSRSFSEGQSAANPFGFLQRFFTSSPSRSSSTFSHVCPGHLRGSATGGDVVVVVGAAVVVVVVVGTGVAVVVGTGVAVVVGVAVAGLVAVAA